MEMRYLQVWLLVVTGALRDVLRWVDDPESEEGGVFALYHLVPTPALPVPIIMCRVGDGFRNWRHAWNECEEKCSKYLETWKTGKPTNNVFGGAVRISSYIAGFGGLTDEANEAVLLVTGVRMGLLSPRAAFLMAESSNNSLFIGKTFWANGKLVEIPALAVEVS